MNATDDDLAALAGEYVLGTLDGAERIEFERRIESDFAARREVYAWQDRLFSLNLVPTPTPAPHSLWGGIEARLPAVVTREGFWSRLSVWRWTGGAAFALSAALAAFIAFAPAPQPLTQHYVAVLQNPERTMAGWVVDASDPRLLRLIPLGDNRIPPDHSLQFWTKAQNADRPTSLGLLPANAVTVIPVDRLPTLEGNQLFEITLEPPAGSPLDRPSGPILFLGRTVSMPAKRTL